MTSKIKSRKTGWHQNPDAVRADILKTATQVFAEHGLSGGRVDEIVRRTQTSKRMIYYYFGDKNGLYLAVLEAAYARVRAGEDALHLEDFDSMEALARLVEFTFDYHAANPDYVRLVMIENIHRATHLKKSDTITQLNLTAIDKLEQICRDGVAEGRFREDIDFIALHWMITSSCLFNVSNRSTFEQLYGGAIYSPEGQVNLKRMIVSAIQNHVAI
ncbi:MAG: TetR/AcrR family transcriptional regulator [Stappiaceae bacterium]